MISDRLGKLATSDCPFAIVGQLHKGRQLDRGHFWLQGESGGFKDRDRGVALVVFERQVEVWIVFRKRSATLKVKG